MCCGDGLVYDGVGVMGWCVVVVLVVHGGGVHGGGVYVVVMGWCVMMG